MKRWRERSGVSSRGFFAEVARIDTTSFYTQRFSHSQAEPRQKQRVQVP
jgi:hypothetical protein